MTWVVCVQLGKGFPWRLWLLSVLALCHNIKLVETVKRQMQEVMLILPGNLGLCKSLALDRSRWRVGDLGDQVRSRRFGNTVHEYTDKRCLQDNGEAKGEAEEDSLAVTEPPTLLLGGKLDATEIRFELVCQLGHASGEYEVRTY